MYQTSSDFFLGWKTLTPQKLSLLGFEKRTGSFEIVKLLKIETREVLFFAKKCCQPKYFDWCSRCEELYFFLNFSAVFHIYVPAIRSTLSRRIGWNSPQKLFQTFFRSFNFNNSIFLAIQTLECRLFSTNFVLQNAEHPTGFF